MEPATKRQQIQHRETWIALVIQLECLTQRKWITNRAMDYGHEEHSSDMWEDLGVKQLILAHS
jgi:hypothetical protein